MKNEDWEKAKKIFAEVRKLPPERRVQYLDKVCPDEKDVRREIESLLDSLDNAESFMESPAIGEVADIIKSSAKKLEKGVRFGHYEIIEQIGTGGMGEVYLAQDKKLDRRVAVKILNEEFEKHESNLERFIREAKAASALNHPNILVIHEIGETDDTNYIVSEHIEGKTLREVLRESPLKLSEVLEIATQIAGALVAAHSAHIIHRDIKPENIMIRPDGFVKILDFGLAKLVRQNAVGLENSTVKQNQTAKGVILGTVNYLSPEQAKGESVDERTDIFSFGIVIYEMITGRIPFAGESVSETFANLINAEPQPLSRFATNISDELQRIVSKMLKKNAEERYQIMKDALTDLKDLRENLRFDEKFESSAQTGEKATEVLYAATGGANRQTSEIQHNFLQRIRQRKILTAFALIVSLIGAIGFNYYFFYAGKTASSRDGKKTLAVLPFVNVSQDPSAEYLSDGITESIINNLSQLSGLKVMSRNSAFRFKNDQTDNVSIASQLGVEILVTGDIRQIGDKFVINVRLIDGKNDSQIWGNQFVKTNADVIAVQNEIAQAVASNLHLKLTGFEQQQLAKRYTDNVEAYQLYLKGRFHIFKLTPTEIQKGISYFQQAIEIDPNYALAYAGLSDAYRNIALSGVNPATEIMPKAKAAANKALQIDERLVEAHTSLSSVIFWYDWDWNAAENQIKRALELDPNNADVRLLYAYLLSNTGRHAEALMEAKRARDLDPLSLVFNALEGQFLLHAGQTDEARDRLQKTFELDSNFWLAHSFASSVYIEKGMYEEAIAGANRAKELNPVISHPVVFLCYGLVKSGKQAEARNELERLLELSKERYVSPYDIALIYNAFGENDETFAWLERGFEQRDTRMTFLKVEPKWNNIRSEPRFVSLLRQMNF